MTEVTPLLLSAAGKASAAATVSVAGGLLLTAAVLTVGLGEIALLGREELIHRELEVLEQGTGVLGIAGTFLVGHTEIISGHQ